MSLDPAERFARLRLARTDRIGPVAFTQLIGRYGSALSALDALPGRNCLILAPRHPERGPAIEAALRDAGFTHLDLWFQCFNFGSMIAIKASDTN